MVAILSQSQVISKDTIFLGERECVCEDTLCVKICDTLPRGDVGMGG